MSRFKEINKALIKSRKNTFLLSASSALLLLFICYFADNIGYSILSGPSVGQRIEQLREITGTATDVIPEEYLFVNIAYDKELVQVFDEYGFPKGHMDITDRMKLTSFLNKLNNSHKFILFDILLSDEYKSKFDPILIEALNKTDRISISQSHNTNLIDSSLIGKGGYIDYYVDIYETNFVKYEFLKDGHQSMPYMAFKSIEPNNPIYSFGPFYWSNGHLIWKSLTLRFPVKLWNDHNTEVDDSKVNFQEKKILNIGADILDMNLDIPSLVKNKIVVIGDFTEDDIHDTYLGKIAGPVINVNALEALRNNELEIPWWLIIFLFVFYTLLTYILLRNKKLLPDSMNHLIEKRKFLRFILSFIGFSLIFSILGGVIYIVAGLDINIIIPSVWFTLIKGMTNTFYS